MRRTVSDPSVPIPRWLLATLILLSLSIFINYIDRGNLATAAPLIKDELGLSASQLGFLLTAFFIAYTPMQIVVGWLADRFGAARVLMIGFTVWSVAMSLTGLVHGFTMLVALRLLLGIGESVSFPATSSIIARCFPESRRGMANAVFMTGMACGPAAGIFFGGLLIAAYGWRWFFVGFGLVSLLWVIPWLLIAQRRLVEHRAANVDAGSAPGIRAILHERSLWGASLGHFCANYVWYFVLSWMPFYLVHERHWSVMQMARIGGSAYLLMALATMTTGWLTDRLIASGSSRTIVRKSFLAIGAGVAAVCVAGCAVVDAGTSVFVFMLACAAFGLVSPNIYAVAQTLAGANAAGRWVGIQNCIGNFAGIVAPFLTGVLVDRTGNFVLAFMIAAAVCALGGIAWVFAVGPVAQIDWARQAQLPASPARSVAQRS
jgi:ACS family D-galactonate transporter-like MFS transporter